MLNITRAVNETTTEAPSYIEKQQFLQQLKLSLYKSMIRSIIEWFVAVLFGIVAIYLIYTIYYRIYYKRWNFSSYFDEISRPYMGMVSCDMILAFIIGIVCFQRHTIRQLEIIDKAFGIEPVV